MPPKSNQVRIQHMLAAARTAFDYCQGKTVADLEDDLPGQCLLVRSLEVIGEAANRVSKDVQERYPAIPWRKMIDMRNILIHMYFDIDYEIVWQTVNERVPELISQLEVVLATERDAK